MWDIFARHLWLRLIYIFLQCNLRLPFLSGAAIVVIQVSESRSKKQAYYFSFSQVDVLSSIWNEIMENCKWCKMSSALGNRHPDTKFCLLFSQTLVTIYLSWNYTTYRTKELADSFLTFSNSHRSENVLWTYKWYLIEVISLVILLFRMDFMAHFS